MQGQESQLKILDLLDDPAALSRDAASLKSQANEVPQEYEVELVLYLEGGTQLFCTLWAIHDHFGDEDKFVGDPSIMTDGTWFWRKYLPYFVKTYHFRLPQEFVEHARSTGWKVPAISYEQEKPLIAEYHKLREMSPDS